MGKYLEITMASVRPEASEGELVIVLVGLKNKHTADIHACLTGSYDDGEMQTNWTWLKANTEYSWNLRFTMPNHAVTIWVWAWYMTATGNPCQSAEDQAGPLEVALAGVTPPPSGTIAEIRDIKVCDESYGPSSPPQPTVVGKMLSIHFVGMNLSDVTRYFDATVWLRKPSAKVEEKRDVSYLPYTPGSGHPFKFDNCWKADEVGTYYATIVLYTRTIPYGTSQEADRKTNVKLFTVSEAPEEPEPTPDVYDGKIENKMVDWTNIVSGAKPFPLAEPAPVGENMRISFEGYNLSDVAMRLRAEVWIYGPGKRETYHDEDISTLTYTKGSAHKFTFPKAPSATPIDEEGEWTVKIQLTNSTGEYLLDEYDGPLFSAEPPPTSMWTMVVEIMPLVMLMMMFGMLIPMTRELGQGATKALEAG